MNTALTSPLQLCTMKHVQGFGKNLNESDEQAQARITKELRAHIKTFLPLGKIITAVTAQYQDRYAAPALEAAGFKTFGPVLGTERSTHRGETVTLWQRNLTDEDLGCKPPPPVPPPIAPVKPKARRAAPKTAPIRNANGRFVKKAANPFKPWPVL